MTLVARLDVGDVLLTAGAAQTEHEQPCRVGIHQQRRVPRVLVIQPRERIEMRNGPDEEPVLIEGHIELDRLEKPVCGRTRKEREAVGGRRNFRTQVLADSVRIALEALSGVTLERPPAFEKCLAQERLVIVVAVLIGPQVEIEAQHR